MGALGSDQGARKRGRDAEGQREGRPAVPARQAPTSPSSGLSFPAEKTGTRTPSSTYRLRLSRMPEKTDGNVLENVDHKNTESGDFPSGPVVKNPPCNAGKAGLILITKLRSHMPQGN